MNSFNVGELFEGLVGVTSVSAQFICAALCAVIFAAKGKSWVGGAFMGFFLGPLGVLIAIVSGGWGHRLQRVYVPQAAPSPLPLRPTNTYASPRQSVYRFPGRCPNCNGPVHNKTADARSMPCGYCGSLIEGAPVQ